MRRDCDHSISYIANDFKASERVAFDEHLKNCTECKKRYQELSQPWHVLTFDNTEIEVPESLKGEVLGFVFDHKMKSNPRLR